MLVRLLLYCLLTTMVFAQKPVLYDLSFENRRHYEARIGVTFQDVAVDTLEVRISRTSPGRYALHEFAKNVYEVTAADSRGRLLPINRPDLHQWNISGHDGTVRVEYTLYGDRADGTYSAINSAHAHLNAPATLMWARSQKDRPAEVRIHKPADNWEIVTQLKMLSPTRFYAPDNAYLLDSPIKMADLRIRQWAVGPPEQPQQIRLALHYDGTDEEVEIYTEMAKAVVAEQIAVYGEVPKFDYGEYTFIADYLPHVDGDGMEHRNSTIISSKGSLKGEGALSRLGTLSHEFFHAWNVERIRPQSLEPFDFEAANMSQELWFAEGFTSYYDDLIIHRAGLTSLDKYAEGLTSRLNTVLNSPGRNIFSAAEMSSQAPFVDAARSVDHHNRSNTFISYYTYGSALALGLDLELRTRFRNIDLDDYMQLMWQKFGRLEIPYTLTDLEITLAELTKDAAYAKAFFANHITGREPIPYQELLAKAGLLVTPRNPGKAFAGRLRWNVVDDGIQIRSATHRGSPVYEAGLDRGDKILSLADETIRTVAEFDSLIEQQEIGASIAVRYLSRGDTVDAVLELIADPVLEVVPYEHKEMTVTPEMLALRKAWLGRKATDHKLFLGRRCDECQREFPAEYEYCRYNGERLEWHLKSN